MKKRTTFYMSVAYFIVFFVIISVGIILFKLLEDDGLGILSTVIIVYILAISLMLSVISYMIKSHKDKKPIDDINMAINMLANGNFDVMLEVLDDSRIFENIKKNINILASELKRNKMLNDSFISNVSHEMKTPLAVIISHIKALNNPNITNEKKNEYILSIEKAAMGLNTLVNNILKLNRLENHGLDLDYEEFDLSNSIIEQILLFDEALNASKLTLNCDIDLGIMINSVKCYLDIIWNNLISNAIKFSDENKNIYISLKQINNEIIFKIKDEGIGIDKTTGANIFDKFYQGDTSRKKEGNGLGLSLVKKVIDVLGGMISIESEVGKGSEFTVKLYKES